MNTKALRQKILDLAIHGKLVPQDPNDEPASVLLERIRAEKERLIKEGKIKRPKKTKATSDKPHYENVPFEVPSSWVWCKLHDIIQITNGRSQKDVENVNGKYPIYGSGGIIGKAVEYLCEAGSTIIGRKGTINNPLFVEERFWNIDTAFGMKPMYAISDLYFFYFCQYFDFSKLDKSTAVPSLTQSAIGEVFIPIPPINEQKRITDGISYWLGFIDTLESNLINLQLAIKQTKSKILNLAIHGKLVPQDPTDEPAAELLKRINPKAEITCDNGHYQKLPEGWILTRGKNIFNQMKSCQPFGEDFKYIDIDAIDNKQQKINKIKTIKVANAPSRASRYTQKGDVVFSMVRPYLRNIAIVSENDCIASTGFYVCSPKELLLSGFCYYLMMSDYVVNGLNQYMKGDNSPSINKKNVDDWFFPIPPLKEQHRIVAKIEEIFAQLDAIEASL